MNHFFALPLPEEIRQQIGKLAEEWRGMNQLHASWYAPADYHITLKFLGDVDPSRQTELIEAVAPIVAQAAPFEVDLNAVPGAFPNLRQPRVLWAGVQKTGPMAKLAGAIDRAMAKLGFEAERRPYHPHITLARCREARPIPSLPKEQAFPIFTANSFVLMQTLPPKKDVAKGRIGEKLRYTIVRAFPFSNLSNDLVRGD